ncbi:hypothetical protein SMKI_13G0800 [Saccharomyces mikatae IFO 1815]|uniref:YML053C-like protein n=1 Tax=Saccharomyces mikatae IFO 1815 TaxID=226126 RepID=A0AA35NDE3_SACMI|nr:uncharacterized protein SMKI_13G0800 [Saccharomyces mikatae IFO 1815]CAI4035432.1 hypothetical protein SMKI_13G0800 [Saccharomyces mikatae IFO 1815]
MLSYYEHNSAFQTNNCNSGGNAGATYNSDANNDKIVNKRNNDHFEFDTHSLYQRTKRTKRDPASTKFPASSGAANTNNSSNSSNITCSSTTTTATTATTITTINNIQYQRNIGIPPLKSVGMQHGTNGGFMNESELYSETEEYMIHGYFGNSNHEITNTRLNGNTSIIQHQYHTLPSQNIIASQLPNAANDYMDID